MNDLKKFNDSMKKLKYFHFFIFLILSIYFLFVGDFNLHMALVVGFITVAILASNEKIAKDVRFIIVHVVLSIVAVGFFDFFSKIGSRLDNIGSFMTPIAFFFLSLYGFYLKK
nr:hypothetical protein [Comamonas koreensis]